MSRASCVALLALLSVAALASAADLQESVAFFSQKATDIHEFVHNPASLKPQLLQASAAGATANNALNSLGAGDVSAKFRANLPRWGFPSDISVVASGNTNDMQQYGIGIAIQFGYGIVLAVLTFLVGCCFCCCRCCCNWCGGREPLPEGYTKCQRWGTLLIMLLFALASAVFTALGFYNNDQLSAGLVGNTGITGTILTLLNDAIDFLVSTNANKPGLKTILTNLSTAIGTVVTSVMNIVGSTTVIFTGVGNLQSVVNSTRDAMNNAQAKVANQAYVPNSGGSALQCYFCQNAATLFDQMGQQLRDQSTEPIRQMQDTVKNTNSSLVNIQSSITSQVTDASSKLSEAAIKIADLKTTANTATDSVKTYDGYRNLAVLIILILPCLSFLCMLLGGIFKSGCPFTFYYAFGYFISFIIFLLFAIHLPIAVVLSDSCAYVDIAQANVSTSTQLGSSAKVVDACINNKSLVEVYDLSSYLNFTNQIQFPQVPDIQSKFTIPAIVNFTQQVHSLTLFTAFQYNSNDLDQDLQTLNTQCTATFSRSNLPTSCTAYAASPAACQSACNDAVATVTAEIVFNQTLADLRVNATRLNTTSNNLRADVAAVYAQLNGNLKTVTQPLFDVVQSFRNAAYCGFIGTAYFGLKNAICNTIMNAMTMLSLCFFLIGILNFAVIVCSTILSKRMPNPKSEDAALVVELGPPGSGAAAKFGTAGPIGGAANQASITIAAPPPPLVNIRR